MMNKSLTTMEIKKLNKKNIYQYIYQSKRTSKQDIATHLNMGLTTITRNIQLLEDEGFIQRNGFYDSTGGRRSFAIEIVKNKYISIGIEILKNKIYMIAVNLYGEVIAKKTIDIHFESHTQYCERLSDLLSLFITDNHFKNDSILGVSIILQAIISKDGQKIEYSQLLENSNLSLSDFQQYIPFPCHLEHDSKAAAYLECWHNDHLKDAIVLLLNENLGSAIVTQGIVHKGKNVHSGTIEHMTIDENGPMCYCGHRGCLETYCSASALSSQMNIDRLFQEIRNKKNDHPIWKNYLQYLGKAIHNINTVYDVPIIISGYLASYMNDDDLSFLVQYVQSLTRFHFDNDYLHLSQYGYLSPAIGGALYFIDDFLKSMS